METSGGHEGSGAGSLSRFHTAQAGVIGGALAELAAGRKTGHWIWFACPQLAGLGRSSTAAFYGLADLAEARAYASDPVLAERLTAAFTAVLSTGQSAETILGPVDALKLRSSATLFRAAAEGPLRAAASAVLDRLYGGAPCPHTLAAISRDTSASGP